MSFVVRTVTIVYFHGDGNDLGAALFAKRKQKSEKWIVDENTVKQKTAQAAAVAASAINTPAVQSVEPSATTAPLVPNQSRAEQTQKMASVQVLALVVLN